MSILCIKIFRNTSSLKSRAHRHGYSFRSCFLPPSYVLSYQTGQFAFTYNRGHGECRNPVSKIKSCTEDTRMMLNFQACPDVEGTESTGERKMRKFNQFGKVLIPSSGDSFVLCLMGIILKILIKFLFSLPHTHFLTNLQTCSRGAHLFSYMEGQ